VLLIAKGVYFDSRTHRNENYHNDPPAVSYSFSNESDNTLDTLSSREEAAAVRWSPSNQLDHDRGVPALVRRPEHERYNEPDDKKLLKKIMDRARKLPQESGKYASNHMMVNKERTQRGIPTLRRERRLDALAREHAQLMADEKRLFHTDSPIEIRNRLLDDEDDEPLAFRRLGVNVGKGMRAHNINEIHKHMMAALAERNNIYDKRFHKMGMGTAFADNGVMYLCQIFGG